MRKITRIIFQNQQGNYYLHCIIILIHSVNIQHNIYYNMYLIDLKHALFIIYTDTQ